MPPATRASQSRSDALPPGILSIRDLLDKDRVRIGGLYGIVGVVVDFRAPVETRGSDWKCQMSLYDHSTSNLGDDNILLNIFRPPNEMPDVSLGDVVLVFSAKLQETSGTSSLLSNRSTDIHIYHAKNIPRPPSNAHKALKPPSRKPTRVPDDHHHAYVSSFCHSIPRLKLPSVAEFEDKKLRSVNYKAALKFSLLENVREQTFVDMIVQVVKEPYPTGDLCTLWVSDYTENDAFFKFALKGVTSNAYGYSAGTGMVDEYGSAWPGPFGQRSLQLTCFEPHASFIRDNNIVAGDWLHLLNVQIKSGHNKANLEGFLRHDGDARSGKHQISRLDLGEDPDAIDPRLKEAVARKRAYEKKKKSQLEDLKKEVQRASKRQSSEVDGSDPKSNSNSNSNSNSKDKRKQKRAHLQQQDGMSEVNDVDQQDETTARHDNEEPKEPKAKRKKAEPEPVRSLNNHVRCEHQHGRTSTVAEILQGTGPELTVIDGEEVALEVPFRNVNYRANVRVVNFRPSNLEDFAFSKKVSEYDILTPDDDSEISDSDSDSESRGEDDAVAASRRWEWRFFLKLEDASPETDEESRRGGQGSKNNTVWVQVDNLSAQCLLDLDAADLSSDPEHLEILRQRLFILWGELEEFKARASDKRKKLLLSRPPLDSDEEDAEMKDEDEDEEEEEALQRGFINRPFGCCISEYGIKIPESDPAKADAGNGKRWQRAFALFGTKITV